MREDNDQTSPDAPQLWLYESIGSAESEWLDAQTALYQELLESTPAIGAVSLADQSLPVFVLCPVPARALADLQAPRLGVAADQVPLQQARAAVMNGVSQFAVTFERLNLDLSRFGTGPLVRMVVVTQDIGIFYMTMLRYSVIAITFDPTSADLVDARLCDFADGQREDIDMPSQNLGGDREKRPAALAKGTLMAYFHSPRPDFKSLSDALRPALHEHLNEVDLHYAAVYLDWDFVSAADVFEEAGPRKWLGTREDRIRQREFYEEFGSRLHQEIGEILHILWPLSDSELQRLVLDVASGALYVYPLVIDTHRAYVVGVTLSQDHVDVADHRLRDQVCPEVRRIIVDHLNEQNLLREGTRR
ncbi:hypothetical protein ACIBEJ_10045 [Nonomuraea sp. NPDC050790]|uniref:hypothetical protein n=1 Tax=Nonomuraea sp. NPDC050790 TaxID=3364371 RepID=UPI0037A59922